MRQRNRERHLQRPQPHPLAPLSHRLLRRLNHHRPPGSPPRAQLSRSRSSHRRWQQLAPLAWTPPSLLPSCLRWTPQRWTLPPQHLLPRNQLRRRGPSCPRLLLGQPRHPRSSSISSRRTSQTLDHQTRPPSPTCISLFAAISLRLSNGFARRLARASRAQTTLFCARARDAPVLVVGRLEPLRPRRSRRLCGQRRWSSPRKNRRLRRQPH